MSAFNPNSRQLTPQEWQTVASESLAEDNSQYLIIGGIVAGLFAASATGFPPTGVLIACWGFYAAWKKTQSVNKNEEAISTYKCVAHVLAGDNLRDYRKQVGDLKALEEMQFAKERGYTLSSDAEDFLETQAPLILSPAPQARILPPQVPNNSTITQVSNYVPPSQQEFDVIAAMVGKRIRNQLIVGIQGSGKGILLSNAIEQVQKYHPNRKIYLIDPKGDDKETGYWDGRVDYLRRSRIFRMQPEEVVKWITECFEEYQSIRGDVLLVLDEGTATVSSFKNQKGALSWFKNKISHYVSLGDSDGKNFWIVVQNGDTSDLGITGGMRSQMVPYVIIDPEQASAYESVINLELLPKDKKPSSEAIREMAKRSPVKRALYHGTINEWLPMPRLENYSGFDRDSRTFFDSAMRLNDSVSAEEKQSLRQATATIEKPLSQIEILIQKLETTTETSLDKFIRNQLKVTRGDKKKELREGIIKAIQETNRQDLLDKFGKD